MDQTPAPPLDHLVAASPREGRLAALLAPSVAGLGYTLVRLRVMGAGGRGKPVTLQIMAERPDGSMEIDDCAALSEAVSAVLDVEDPIEGDYTLEVSSPGIDRPLTRPRDFETYAGHIAKVELAVAVEGRKRYRGVVRGLVGEGDAATLELETEADGIVSLVLRDIGDARLIITDALIEDSLKRRIAPSAEGADEIIEIDAPGDDDNDEDGPARPRQGDA